jgi:hypothetical protein
MWGAKLFYVKALRLGAALTLQSFPNRRREHFLLLRGFVDNNP